MLRIRTTIVLMMVTLCTVCAQVTVKMQAPQQVEAGRRFNVRYVVNTQDIEDFQVDDFVGLEKLYGPAVSRSSSFQSINGRTTQSSTMTFTFTIVAQNEGSFTIPAASVVVDGKTYKSSTSSIEVLPGSAPSQQNAAPAQSSAPTQRNYSQQTYADEPVKNGDDLFMAVSVSKQNVYEQEAILVTYKLYTLLNLQQIAGEMPQLDGFHVEELPSKQQMEVNYERMNGHNYATAVWRQYLIYPQKTGRMTIPSVNFETQVVQTNRNIDPFDAFFNGMSMTQVVRRELKTKPITIDVRPLPEPQPTSFSGAVGSFTLSSTLSPTELDANDAATLRVTVTGQGNMKLMKDLSPAFPADFEVYPPKTDENTKLTSAGHKGSVTYEYVIVPRHSGSYELQPVEFCYFDPADKSYHTLHSEAYDMTVRKGRAVEHTASVEREDLRVLANDIRFIHQVGDLSTSEDDDFYGSTVYWLLYAIPFVLTLTSVFAFRRKAKANVNVAHRRSRKANKAASRRLRNASKLLRSTDNDAFYDELIKALLGYAADKFNLPTAELNKDNVREMMLASGVDEAMTQTYLDVLSEAEFARFAPGDPNATKEKLYKAASDAIDRLDDAIR